MASPMLSVDVLAVDFDGVVLETELSAVTAWRELFARHDCRLDHELLRAVAGRRDSREHLLDALQGQRTGLDREQERA